MKNVKREVNVVLIILIITSPEFGFFIVVVREHVSFSGEEFLIQVIYHFAWGERDFFEVIKEKHA